MLWFVIVELLLWFFFLFFLFFLSLLCCCGYIQLIGPQPIIGMIWCHMCHYKGIHILHNEILHHHLVHLSNHLLTQNHHFNSILSSKYLTTHDPQNVQPPFPSPPFPIDFFCLARFYQQQPCRSIQLIQIIPTAITSDHHFAIVSPRCPTGDAIAAAFLRNHKEIKVSYSKRFRKDRKKKAKWIEMNTCWI